MGANLKEVRTRIKSVISTQQITKAMKMVSAAKLRRAQDAIVRMRPYSNKLNAILTNIVSNMDGAMNLSFGEERTVQNALVVVVTSSKGLCGAFNSNIIKSAVKTIDEKFATARQNKSLTIMCIGKKGHEFFKKRYSDCTIISEHVELFNDLSFDNTSAISKGFMDGFEDKTYDAIDVVYGRFKNAGMQFAEAEQFLPVRKLEPEDGGESNVKTRRADFIFEPDQDTLLKNLVPTILQIQFHKFLLDTHASEHGARMTAMDKASENADEILKDLRINYNKARQEAITNELSEIVGGAAALEEG